MTKRRSRLWLYLTLLAIGCLPAGLARAQEQEVEKIETAFTKPMFESVHSFDQIGIVKEVPVEVGDPVKKGDLLVALDDRVAKAELAVLELEAGSSLRVEAAKAALDVSKVQ